MEITNGNKGIILQALYSRRAEVKQELNSIDAMIQALSENIKDKPAKTGLKGRKIVGLTSKVWDSIKELKDAFHWTEAASRVAKALDLPFLAQDAARIHSSLARLTNSGKLIRRDPGIYEVKR